MGRIRRLNLQTASLALIATFLANSGRITNAQVADVPGTTADGWSTASPRDEIRPAFARENQGGADGRGTLVIRADRREGLDGWWTRTFPVTGGRSYRFRAAYRAEAVAVPRRSVVARIVWTDARGRRVPLEPQPVTKYLVGATVMAEPDFPITRDADRAGWTEVSDTYEAPARARRATVELHLRWAPESTVRWSAVSFAETSPPPSRIVHLATVHFRPTGGRTPADNRRMYEPFVAEAARRQADLVVLGETLTYVNLGKSFAEVAEPVPGPSTEDFGRLAKQRSVRGLEVPLFRM